MHRARAPEAFSQRAAEPRQRRLSPHEGTLSLQETAGDIPPAGLLTTLLNFKFKVKVKVKLILSLLLLTTNLRINVFYNFYFHLEMKS